jgi:hypothetical protein
MKTRRTKVAPKKKNTLETTKLVPASEDLKEWAALLGSELVKWPGVRTKSSFGMTSFYRRERIFAMLPKTRALTPPHTVILKFHRENAATRKARAQLNGYPASGWVSFELQTEKDLGPALRWLDLAYRMAK